jgi:predicted GNAT family acetyltransferase
MSYENIPIHLNKDKHRFEMVIDGDYAVVNYRQSGNIVNLVHTEVAEPLEGKGIAAALVEKTLQYLDEHQLRMIPSCSYVQQYLNRHPEWKRLVVSE